MATELQLLANRQNSGLSTGPVSAEGKATASRNALRHGLKSTRLVLDDEDPDEFTALLEDLAATLVPVGSVELVLVERIAIAIWRQRRLVQAETAGLRLSRQPVHTARAVTSELRREYGMEIKPEDLVPFDGDRAAFCRAVLSEIEILGVIDLGFIAENAPTVLGQLKTDAEGEALETFLAGRSGGLTGYVGELILWCRKELRVADDRPHVLAIAGEVKARASVLPAEALDLLSRYQSTLDNQLYKALRALREAQEWRLKSMASAGELSSSAGHVVDAA